MLEICEVPEGSFGDQHDAKGVDEDPGRKPDQPFDLAAHDRLLQIGADLSEQTHQRLTFLRIDAAQCTLIAASADVMDLFGERTPFFRKIGHGGAPVARMRMTDDQLLLCHPGQQRCHRRFIQHTSLGDLLCHRPVMLKQIQQDLRLSRHQLQLRRLRNDGAVAEVKAPQQLKMQLIFQHPAPPFSFEFKLIIMSEVFAVNLFLRR